MTIGPLAKQASQSTLWGPDSPASMMLPVSLSLTNYVAQYAGGAPVSDAVGPFTVFAPTRLPQITLGAGGVAVTYTLTSTDLAGKAQTETLAFTVAATKKFTKPVATIVSITSNVDPVGTTDLQAGDTWVSPPARWLIVGSAGTIAMQLFEDAAVATSPSIPAGVQKLAIQRITPGGSASALALLF